MPRRLLILAFLVSILSADPRQEVYDLLGSMASSLSQEDAGDFLAAFDKSMKGYDELAVNVRALVAQMDVVSSIDLIDDAGNAERRTMRVDWILELKNKNERTSLLRRQKTVQLQFEKRGRKWRVVGLEPLDFFAPPIVKE
jgi:hypothetical protein